MGVVADLPTLTLLDVSAAPKKRPSSLRRGKWPKRLKDENGFVAGGSLEERTCRLLKEVLLLFFKREGAFVYIFLLVKWWVETF